MSEENVAAATTESALVEETTAPEPTPSDESVEAPEVSEDKTTSEGPPDSYDLGLPEGFQANPDLLAEASTVFKDIGLTNDQAKQVASLMPKANELAQAEWVATTEAWSAETLADPEVSKNAEAVMQRNANFVSEFGDAELAELLETYGIGKHRSVVKAFNKVMVAMGEDGTPSASSTTGSQQSTDEKLRSRYASMFPQD
jgi:hypothetical protein